MKDGFGTHKKAERTASTRRVDLSEFEEKATREAKAAGTIITIDKKLIKPDPDQPRKEFTESSLIELGKSIEENGLIQPIIVREAGDGAYIINCGERRWRSIMLTSLPTIEAIVRNDVSGLDLLRMQVHENEHKENMRPLDLARVYKTAWEALGKDLASVCEWANKSKAYISSFLLLADAPAEVQALGARVTDATSLQLIARLVKNSPEEGRALIESIESGAITANGGSVREAIRQQTGGEKKTSGSKAKVPESKAKAPTYLKAEKAEWQHTDAGRTLAIETAAGVKLVIELPKGFE